MRVLRPALVAAAAAILSGTALLAQTTERSLYVSALDSDGKPVTGLGQTDFTVREDGQSREVLRVSRAVEPIDIALIVDNSQAITAIVNDVRQSVKAFLARQVKDGNSVALIGMADRPTILQDYTSSGAALDQAASRIFSQPGSGTTILDALVDTSRGIAKRDAQRRVMIVITTEGTDFSTPNYQRALDAIRDSGAALYALVLTSTTGDAFATEEGRNRGIVLDQGTNDSGGRQLRVISSMALGSRLDAVAAELEQQYHVVYGQPGALIPPKKIEVRVNRPGVTARGIRAATPPKPSSGE